MSATKRVATDGPEEVERVEEAEEKATGAVEPKVREWLDSDEGKREVAAALERIRQAQSHLEKVRTVNPSAISLPYTL